LLRWSSFLFLQKGEGERAAFFLVVAPPRKEAKEWKSTKKDGKIRRTVVFAQIRWEEGGGEKEIEMG